MQITYLKNLENNKVIAGRERKGLTETAITQLETEFSVNFPNAYKEYLFLAGDISNITESGDNEDYKEIVNQKLLAEKALNSAKVNIDRPYWIINDMDNCQVFTFFYLDETVNADNPPVYNCLPAYINDGYDLIEKTSDSFVDYVSRAIEHFKKFEEGGQTA